MEKDLGVLMNDKMKPADQCRSAVRTALAVLKQISRAFHFRYRHVFLRLYKKYVRPHLEFSTQAWSLWNEEDINCLEKAQEHAFKMVSGLHASMNVRDGAACANRPELEFFIEVVDH